MRRWDNQLAGYIKAGFHASRVGILANGSVTYISKLVTVATMWLGPSW